MFGAKKVSDKDLEILKLKEQILSRDISDTKFKKKEMVTITPEPTLTISDKEKFISSLTRLIFDFIHSETVQALKEAEKQKQESIIKAKQEQFNNDVKGFEENKLELIKNIRAEIDNSIKSANNHHDGAIALMYLGDLKRKIEEM
jgi:hypothetical protein